MATVKARLTTDGHVAIVHPDGSLQKVPPREDWSMVDAATEADIERQAMEDDAAAAADAAAYVRGIRVRTGLSQQAFALRIGVPVDTLRNWEQGKRSPQGPARALLRVLDRAPDVALVALGE